MSSKQWSYPTRLVTVIIGLIGLVWLIIVTAPLTQVLILAGLLAYFLNPISRIIERETRFNYAWSARIVYVLFLAVLGAIPAALSTMAFSQFDRIEKEFLEAIVALGDWLAQPVIIFGFYFQPLAVLDNIEASMGSTLGTWSGGAVSALLNVTTNLLWVLTALVSLYYFLVEAPKIKPALVRLVPTVDQEDAQLLLDEIDNAWRLFLRAQLVIFMILAALLASSTFLVLWLYRAGLLPLSSIGLIVLLIVVYTLVQQVDNIWLRPYFFGGQLQLHPGVVFVGLIVGLALGGVLGVIIIVPCLATAKIVGQYIHRKVLGLPPWPELVATAATDTETVSNYAVSQAAGQVSPGVEPAAPDLSVKVPKIS